MNIKELIEKLKEFPEYSKVGIQAQTYKEGGKEIDMFTSFVFEIEEGFFPNSVFLKIEDSKHKEEYVHLLKQKEEERTNEH